MNSLHPAGGVAGNSTDGLAIAGEGGNANVETWDGTNWTEVTDVNTGRGKGIAFGGGSTDGLLAGGFTPGGYVKNTEVWNGTTWTETTDMTDFHQSGGSGGSSSTLGIGFGGDSQAPPGASRTGKTEQWNGSTWTELADMATARMDLNYGKVGTGRLSLAIGGDAPPATTATEEWTVNLANKTITAS